MNTKDACLCLGNRGSHVWVEGLSLAEVTASELVPMFYIVIASPRSELRPGPATAGGACASEAPPGPGGSPAACKDEALPPPGPRGPSCACRRVRSRAPADLRSTPTLCRPWTFQARLVAFGGSLIRPGNCIREAPSAGCEGLVESGAGSTWFCGKGHRLCICWCRLCRSIAWETLGSNSLERDACGVTGKLKMLTLGPLKSSGRYRATEQRLK